MAKKREKKNDLTPHISPAVISLIPIVYISFSAIYSFKYYEEITKGLFSSLSLSQILLTATIPAFGVTIEIFILYIFTYLRIKKQRLLNKKSKFSEEIEKTEEFIEKSQEILTEQGNNILQSKIENRINNIKYSSNKIGKIFKRIKINHSISNYIIFIIIVLSPATPSIITLNPDLFKIIDKNQIIDLVSSIIFISYASIFIYQYNFILGKIVFSLILLIATPAHMQQIANLRIKIDKSSEINPINLRIGNKNCVRCKILIINENRIIYTRGGKTIIEQINDRSIIITNYE